MLRCVQALFLKLVVRAMHQADHSNDGMTVAPLEHELLNGLHLSAAAT